MSEGRKLGIRTRDYGRSLGERKKSPELYSDENRSRVKKEPLPGRE